MRGVLAGASIVWTVGMAVVLVGAEEVAGANATRTCLVLADGYVSEYAWGTYGEGQFPRHHPGHDYCVRGLLRTAGRFDRWLEGWRVRRVDLERHVGPLDLGGVDLLVLDDVRQTVCDPHEAAIVEFTRGGGGLLVYAGHWGLGGCAKTEYSVAKVVASYQSTLLGAVLPVQIVATPDHELLRGKRDRKPRFVDGPLVDGIETPAWEVHGLHACKARGEVLAELAGHPLICTRQFGQGRIVVYTGDDVAWVRAGAGSSINPFAGTLWRRLAALAVGDASPIPARPDPLPSWDKPAAFAHPDQPMNFQWGGYFYYRTPEMLRLWARDLVTHSATVYFKAPEALGQAGVQGWESFGCPLMTKASAADESARRVDAAGKSVKEGLPCCNNPKALKNMDAAVAERATELAAMPWVVYGHMGDETEFGDCTCEHCRRAFREQIGGELPKVENDFSPAYLDRWIDYCLFKNQSVGRMYARAAQVARQKNPRLKMFASLPQSGGMAHGDDQYHTQSGFDLLWDHTYPGTMVIRVGLNASLMEATAVLQGRPYVPVLDLLQGFDSYDRAPHMPPPEYVREMVWQAIAHGVDSIGWFVYNAFWWVLPGTEAWAEIGRLGHDVLEPLTPTLYEMRNTQQPVGLLYCYSQEAVDGLKERVWDDARPWKDVVRWWSHHATQEAYEVLKYAHVPFNVVSEHRLFLGKPLPWSSIVIPYVEHLHAKSSKALTAYMARGGTVYVGANSTLDLAGVKKLPVSFDAKFTTWWPETRRSEWNQRRVRAYLIDTFLAKARRLRDVFSAHIEASVVAVDDPQVVFNIRESGAARYVFLVNDHQINPTSPELRKRRQRYNHFMLMPMRFPKARTTITIRSNVYAYPILKQSVTQGVSAGPIELGRGSSRSMTVELDGGDGQVLLLLPEKITAVEISGQPLRAETSVTVKARIVDRRGPIAASLPLRIDLECGDATQTVYATTKNGALDWAVPFLKAFPNKAMTITVTDVASGQRAVRQIH